MRGKQSAAAGQPDENDGGDDGSDEAGGNHYNSLDNGERICYTISGRGVYPRADHPDRNRSIIYQIAAATTPDATASRKRAACAMAVRFLFLPSLMSSPPFFGILSPREVDRPAPSLHLRAAARSGPAALRPLRVVLALSGVGGVSLLTASL